MAWAPDYCSLAELKSFVKITDTEDDDELGFAAAAASRAVDQHTGRQFGQVATAEERDYPARWDRRRERWIVQIDDVEDITAMTVIVEAGAVDVFQLEPVNAVKKKRVFTAIVVDPDAAFKPTGGEALVTVDALWGWTAFPAAVKQATLLQASRLFSRRTSPYGIAGSPEQGSELRLLAVLDPDVKVSLRPYIRWWAAA